MNTWVEAPPRQKGWVASRGVVLFFWCLRSCWRSLALLVCIGDFNGTLRSCTVFIGWRKLIPSPKGRCRCLNSPARTPKFKVSANVGRISNRRREQVKPVEIELTADDINALIAANRNAWGKVFVSIEGNQLRIQASTPLGEILNRPGYYFNGDITVEFKGAESLGESAVEPNCGKRGAGAE